MVNSGTEQDAVLDFTIPRGQTGESGTPVELLSAYSTPLQSGTDCTPLIFDRNGLIYSTSVGHSADSADFTVNQPGVYSVAFHGSFSPGSGVDFPVTVSASLEQGGSSVPGGSALHTFHTSGDSANLAFHVPVEVSAVPTTLQVVGSGASYLYGVMGITITRMGDIPT